MDGVVIQPSTNRSELCSDDSHDIAQTIVKVLISDILPTNGGVIPQNFSNKS